MKLSGWEDPPSEPDPAPDSAADLATAVSDDAAARLVAPVVATTVTDRLADVVVPVVDQALAGLLSPSGSAQLEAAARAAVSRLLTPDPEPAPPPLRYRTVDEFVQALVIPVFRRNVGPRHDARWAARWWESAEAIMRLEAMWRSWESMSLNAATGVSVWLRDHADHHMAVLLSPTGPFARSLDEAKASDPLPYEPPPAGLFTPVA